MEITFIIIPVDEYLEQDDRLQEISSLAFSAGANVVGNECVKITKIVPSTYVGKGKLELIKGKCEELNCNLVIFDGELSPSQTLNMSDALGGIKVIDRTTLILDIFASQAKSSEGKIQVELAQLKYIYPRLKGKGSALSRLGGGIGTRGPGETQLETDRRHIRRRINYLEDRLKELQNRRQLQSERRNKNGIFKVALVGYTNTGKSTTLNALTESDVLVENKLFATLDTTTRKLNLGDFTVLLSDTVGFIKNIPTTLIEAFKSTLEVVVDADLVLIVCDATNDWFNQYETTNEMLNELKSNAFRILVFNKCENITDFTPYPADSVFISAKEKKGLDGLLNKIRAYFESNYSKLILKIPYTKISLFHSLQKYIESLELNYTDECLIAKITVNNNVISKFDILK